MIHDSMYDDYVLVIINSLWILSKIHLERQQRNMKSYNTIEIKHQSSEKKKIDREIILVPSILYVFRLLVNN